MTEDGMESKTSFCFSCWTLPDNSESVDAGERLLKAAFDGELQDLTDCLSSGVDIASVDVHGYFSSTLLRLTRLGATALHIACLYGHLPCVQHLISAGAQVNCEDDDGSTPLHKASFSGQVECAKYLLEEAAADVNYRDSKHATPLHIAAFKGQMETALLLIEHGADINAVDSHDVTPVHHTCFQGHVEFTKALIDRGASVCFMLLWVLVLESETSFAHAAYRVYRSTWLIRDWLHLYTTLASRATMIAPNF